MAENFSIDTSIPEGLEQSRAKSRLGLAGLALLAVMWVAADKANAVVCDTTGFPHADGSVNTTGTTRGAVFADADGDGLNERQYGEDGRACSVPLEYYKKQWSDGDRDQPEDPDDGGGLWPDA